MKWKKWLENWDMTGLQINAAFLKMEWKPQVADQNAAWELYVELLTRVTTQALQPEDGDEATALESVYSLFPTTREIIKKYGRDADTFTKLAIVVLNQVIRPFTAKWHRIKLQSGFDDPKHCKAFRKELAELQKQLDKYAKMLADIAKVEDLTVLEKT